MPDLKRLRLAWLAISFPPATSNARLNDLKSELASIDSLVAQVFAPGIPSDFVGHRSFLEAVQRDIEVLSDDLIDFLGSNFESTVALSYLGYLQLLDGVVRRSLYES
jgi:hypothetical protein